jgi:hypothetical protein
MERGEVAQYYQVVNFLEIRCLIALLRSDMIDFIDRYELFGVMAIARETDDRELFEACLEQLRNESFEQIKYHEFELMQTELPLFKQIIEAHNQHRLEGNPGVEFTQIDQILKDYCRGKCIRDCEYRSLKLELINKEALTAS